MPLPLLRRRDAPAVEHILCMQSCSPCVLTCSGVACVQEAATAAYAREAFAAWPLLRRWDAAAAYTAERVRKVSAMVAARSHGEFLARELLAPA